MIQHGYDIRRAVPSDIAGLPEVERAAGVQLAAPGSLWRRGGR
jgi:hypothetical protein